MNESNNSSNGNEAENAYKRALEHHKNGRLEDAVREYALTVRLSPYSPEVYNNFGVALRALGRPHGAIACYRRSLGIRPRAASVLTNLGNAFRDLGMIKRSIAAHERALKIPPISANAHFNAALAFRDGGQVELALEHFQKALALDPANIEIKMEMGISLLRAGEWKEGFQLLEARLKIPRFANKRTNIELWQKQPLNGKTLLITHEGSSGTLVMMARFARNLKLMGAKIIMEAPEKVLPLLRLSPDIDEVINIGANIDNVDYQVGLLSVPERLGITINNIPGETPYLRPSISPAHELEINPAIKLAVGIAWSDKTLGATKEKSGGCNLEDLMEIVALPGLQAFSLVSGDARKEITQIGVEDIISDGIGDNNDLAEIAGIIEQLDLIITLDGAVAHVAGALGKPTWLLLPPGADWCWLLERDDTPWYPNIRIFRKTPEESWGDLGARVRKSLHDVLQ